MLEKESGLVLSLDLYHLSSSIHLSFNEIDTSDKLVAPILISGPHLSYTYVYLFHKLTVNGR